MQMILYSALAGILGTGLGGLIGVLVGTRSKLFSSWMLSFASGIMISIATFSLLPEADELAGLFVTLVGLVIGVLVVMALNRVVDTMTEAKSMDIHHTTEELFHFSFEGTDRKAMFRSGILMLVAIALHSLPEGIAIGAAGTHDAALGAALAIAIALHCIPEGMAIAAPLLIGGVSRRRVVFLTALAGTPTLVGGAIGVLFGSISDVAIALSLAGAGGAMLYVVFGEVIPQAVMMSKSRMATIVTLAGVVIGIIISHAH